MRKKVVKSLVAIVVLSCLLAMSSVLALAVSADESLLQENSEQVWLEAKQGRSGEDFPTWSQWRDRYPYIPVHTIELQSDITWLTYVSMMDREGYFIVPFFPNGISMEYRDLSQYPSTGQHMIVFPDDSDFPLFYDVVVNSGQPTPVPTTPSNTGTTVRPSGSGGVNITINNTNVNINGSSVSIPNNIAGLVRMAKALNGTYQMSAAEIRAYDFNGNGYIDIPDLVIMASLLS